MPCAVLLNLHLLTRRSCWPCWAIWQEGTRNRPNCPKGLIFDDFCGFALPFGSSSFNHLTSDFKDLNIYRTINVFATCNRVGSGDGGGSGRGGRGVRGRSGHSHRRS